ncbi:hypothetical protein LINPERPRIM_LOCUS5086, partial [Linum perenne]
AARFRFLLLLSTPSISPLLEPKSVLHLLSILLQLKLWSKLWPTSKEKKKEKRRKKSVKTEFTSLIFHGLPLQRTFALCSSSLVPRHSKGKNRGLAFVTMGSPEKALSAMKKLDGYEYQGRVLRTNYVILKNK